MVVGGISTLISDLKLRLKKVKKRKRDTSSSSHHLHPRHLASYLSTVLKTYYKHSRETGISKTNKLIEGLVGKTVTPSDSGFTVRLPVDEPAHNGPREHVDPAQQAASP
jgi:hypothetical protein